MLTKEQADLNISVDINLGDVAPASPDPVAEGREAWKRINAAAKMMREDWRKVGEALMVGRKLHRSDKLFGQWVRDNGFGEIDRRVRSDALWLVDSWAAVHVVDSSICHPTHIRTAYVDVMMKRNNAGAINPQDQSSTIGNQNAQSSDTKSNDDAPHNGSTSASGDGDEPVKRRSIFDDTLDDDTALRLDIGELIGVHCANGTDLFASDFERHCGPDYFVYEARAKLINEMRSGRSAQDALLKAQEAIRDAEDQIRGRVEQALLNAGNRAMARFLLSTQSNPLFNDPMAGKLLTRAMDERSSTFAERRKAVDAIKSRLARAK